MGLEQLLRPTVKKLSGIGSPGEKPLGIAKYLADDSDIGKYLAKSPQYKQLLEQSVRQSYEKYHTYLKRPVGRFIEDSLDKLGFAANIYFFYNPIAALGAKLATVLGRTAADSVGLAQYSMQTGDYLAIPKLLAAKVLSYMPIPDLLVDSTLTGLVKRRISDEAKRDFLKAAKAYQPRLDRIRGAYSNVKDRAKNIFKPVDFGPQAAYA